MQTREEKLARWIAPPTAISWSCKVLKGSVSLTTQDLATGVLTSEDQIQVDQITHFISEDTANELTDDANDADIWHFKVISFPRLRSGRLVLSMDKHVFQHIQDCWNLHPRTIEVFLSNNGVFTSFENYDSRRTSVLLKVANSRSTGFDCISVTCDTRRRTTYALYHHLEDETSVFATLLSTPERCIEPHFFVAALYRSHHQHIETHRNTIDDTVQGIERQTGFGNPGRLVSHGVQRRPSLEEYPVLADPKSTIQQLSYCQTDLAIIGHVARCCVDSGEWLLQAIDTELQRGHSAGRHSGQLSPCESKQESEYRSEHLTTIRLLIRQDVEYVRRRTTMLLSQVQQMRDRAQNQTTFILNTITQSDAEFTAAIAVDVKRDSIAMKTIAILGIVFLPGTFVATIFSINMFDWGGGTNEGAASLSVSRSMWIYWAITVPLTLMTFLIWVFWSRRENHESNKRFMIYRTKAAPEPDGPAVTKTVGLFAGEKMV